MRMRMRSGSRKRRNGKGRCGYRRRRRYWWRDDRMVVACWLELGEDWSYWGVWGTRRSAWSGDVVVGRVVIGVIGVVVGCLSWLL